MTTTEPTPSPSLAQLALGYGRRVDQLERSVAGITGPLVAYVEALRADRNRLAATLAAVHPDGPQTAEPEPAPAPWAVRVSQAVAAAQARAPRPTEGGMPGIGR